MQNIEPHYAWRDYYTAENDERSPFFGREYSEFEYSNKIYNFYIHPQWDEFGAQTLYAKLLFVDYDEGCAIIELLGEWNDTINNDAMWLKREIIDPLTTEGIAKWIVIGENVLNFHGGDDDYYAEWYEEATDEGGWICFFNFQDHVCEELSNYHLYNYICYDEPLNTVNWRKHKPQHIVALTEALLLQQGRIR
jgi:hypothetical protein